MSNLGSGYFLQFTPDEEKELINILEENGLEISAEGIKDLILEGSDEKEAPSTLADKIRENPEIVEQGAAALFNLGSKLMNAKVFKKK